MDPVKKIESLEVEREALKKQLLVPGIDKDREIAIRKNVDTIGAEITGWTAHVVVDHHWFYYSPSMNFVGITGIGFGMAVSGSAFYYPGYCVWRQTKFPYTQRQIDFRRLVFGANFPNDVSPAAKRLALRAFQGFLGLAVILRVRSLFKKQPK